MYLKVIFLGLLYFISIKLCAQTEYKHCGSTEAQKELLEQHPEYSIPMQQMQEYFKAMDKSKLQKTRGNKYIIPIVFHVIHNYGPENISDEQIYDEVRILNRDFQKLNADTADVVPAFDTIIGNPNFEFRLANKDPEGNCTNGIDRIASYKTYKANDQSKLNPWNRAHYFNVWVVNSIGKANTAGYAYKPDVAHLLFYYDGVIILHDYVGSIGTGNAGTSRALTHEIGHCMNLDHTWGATNDPAVSCGDDQVQDTPESKGHTQCTAITLADMACNPTIVENTQNYMEYAYCSVMFTKGQADRMTSTINSMIAQRNSLFGAQAHFFTGVDGPKNDCPPRADFIVNRQFCCVGNSVTFTNKSYNDTIASLSWDFGNSGNPVLSTSLSPVPVTFTNTGWKNISLTATSDGGTNSIVKNNWIYVADPTGKQVVGQVNSFEDENDFNSKWINFNYYNNNYKWEHYQWGGYFGTKCIRYRGFDDRTFPQSTTGSAKEDTDDLITEAYDLSSLSPGNAYLNFFLAGATRAGINAEIDDSLLIYFSPNCGTSWISIAKLTSVNLINNGYTSDEFNYSPNVQWMAKYFALPATALTSSTFFKLRFKPGDKSNNIYLDNFEINATPVSVKEYNASRFNIEVVPNPATRFSILQINSSFGAIASLKITNLLGQHVASLNQKISTGLNQINIPDAVFKHSGIYFVTLEMDGKKETKKLLIQ